MAQKLTIEFKAKGDKALILAIKQMDDATKQLQGQTSVYRDELKKLNKTQKRNNKVTMFGTKNLRNMGKGVGRLGVKFSVLRSKLLLLSFAFALMTKAVSALVGKMAEQEKAEKKLEAAIGKNTKALINQAAALQQVTIFGDEVIISAQALIGAYTDDEEQLKKATEATLDLAAAKGMDLNAAADLVGKSLGSSTNALARYGVEVRGVRGSTERLESLTTNVARLFGGQARAATDTLSGSIEQMKNAIGDANEILGEEFVPIIKAISKAMKEGAENAGEWIRNLRGETDLDKLIRTIEKAGGDADKLRLKREKDRLSSIQGQLKVGASLGMLEGAKTIEQEKQLTLMDDQFNAMEDLNLSSEEYNKLLATSEKTAEKW